ncbi:MAG: hypothetical protein MK081_11440 [Flavobacteriales bacterium]|nr:hypothetical protein [Flavobacteriales bacterium]
MKRLISLAALIGCVSISSLGQQYVIKEEGDTLSGESLVFVDPIMKAPYFLLDSVQINWDDIALARNQHGVFVNVSDISSGKASFAMRIRKGELSIFEKVDMSVYGEDELPTEMRTGQERRHLARGNMDYLMDEGELFAPTYQNLSQTLQSSERAMGHLQEMRKHQWIKRGLLCGGAGLVTASIITMDGGFAISPQLILGLISTGSSFFVNAAIDDYRWMAVESYNIEASLAQN